MAIGLEDVRNSKKETPRQVIEESKKNLRPWESFDQFQRSTRTLAAQEAVKRARDIVSKNEEFGQQMKDNFFNEVSKFSKIDKDLIEKQKHSPKKSSTFQFLKGLLFN